MANALAYAVLILVSLAVVGFFVVNIIQDSYVANLEERLAHEAGLVGEAAARYLEEPVDFPGLRAATDRAGQLVDARVTIIGADGQVLADTWQPPGDLANQTGQPEVREALGSGLAGLPGPIRPAIRPPVENCCTLRRQSAVGTALGSWSNRGSHLPD